MNDKEAAESFFALSPIALADEVLRHTPPAAAAAAAASLHRAVGLSFPSLALGAAAAAVSPGDAQPPPPPPPPPPPRLRDIAGLAELFRPRDGPAAAAAAAPPRAAAVAALFERTLAAALQLLAPGPCGPRGGPAVLYTRATRRTVYRVGEHHCLGGWHCDCSAFRYQVVNRGEASCCKHILALVLCGAVGGADPRLGASLPLPDSVIAAVATAEAAVEEEEGEQRDSGEVDGEEENEEEAEPVEGGGDRSVDNRAAAAVVAPPASSAGGRGAGPTAGHGAAVSVPPVVERGLTWRCITEQQMADILAGPPPGGSSGPQT